MAAEPTHTDAEIRWSLVVLPDTQHYVASAFAGRPEMLLSQTSWIADNAERLKLAMALGEGDITETNSPNQWAIADDAYALLDEAQIPYALSIGNHDYEGGGSSRATGFNASDHFGVGSAYRAQPSFGGHYGPDGGTENSFHLFSTPEGEWLVLCLEFGPRDAVVDWAKETLERYPEHNVILLTHAYLYEDGTRYDWEKYGEQQGWSPHSYGIEGLDGGVNDGEALWDKLVSRHDRFRLTFSGHVLHSGVARLASAGSGGQPVHQMLFNRQGQVEGSDGGEGYLRILSLLDDGDTLSVSTFSPWLQEQGKDPWLGGDDHRFELSLQLR